MTRPRLMVPLRYSSVAKQVEYQGVGPVAGTLSSSLTYDQISVAEHLGAGKATVQARLKGRTVFMPDLDIRKNFRTKAVIDRMIIQIEVKVPTSWTGIRAAIKAKTGISCMVGDLARGVLRKLWCESINLPAHMAGAAPGKVFAVLIQDPKPDMLAALLRAIENRCGLKGDVPIWLLEVSLDFYPRDTGDLTRNVILREQMVGLVQRHHHCARALPSHHKSDARQVYERADGKGNVTNKPSYLFASPRGDARGFPDDKIVEQNVRKRLKHFPDGHQLFLDSTLYKGSSIEKLQFSIQHKIADQRNPATTMKTVLLDLERRARLEVMIQGTEELACLGLMSISDLKGYIFRDLHKKYLTLWLPTAGEDIAEEMMIRRELQNRGVYGSEHMLALQAYQAKETIALATKTPGRKKPDRTGKGVNTKLMAWTAFNDASGEAIDALTKVWRKFSFTGL